MTNFTCFLLVVLAVFGAVPEPCYKTTKRLKSDQVCNKPGGCIITGDESSVVRKNTKELLQSANDLNGLQMGDKYFLLWEEFVPQDHVRGDLLSDSDNNIKEHKQDLPLSYERDDRNDQLGYPELICYLGKGPSPKKMSCTGSCYLTAYWGPLGYHIERGCAPQHHNTRSDKRFTRYCNTNLCNLK